MGTGETQASWMARRATAATSRSKAWPPAATGSMREDSPRHSPGDAKHQITLTISSMYSRALGCLGSTAPPSPITLPGLHLCHSRHLLVGDAQRLVVVHMLVPCVLVHLGSHHLSTVVCNDLVKRLLREATKEWVRLHSGGRWRASPGLDANIRVNRRHFLNGTA